LQVLNIIDAMVRLGFYENEKELKSMADPMITLLDGSLDFFSREEEIMWNQKKQLEAEGGKSGNFNMADINASSGVKDRYKKNEKNLVIMETKNKIILILMRVIDIQNDMRLTKFLQNYKRHKFDMEMERNVYLLHCSMTDKAMKKTNQNTQEVSNTAVKWVENTMKDTSLDLQELSDKDFVCILLDIILY
jgi:hypothetical protein